jgi:hypothetical protein
MLPTANWRRFSRLKHYRARPPSHGAISRTAANGSSFRFERYRHRRYGLVATTVGTGVVTLRPNGPVGVLIIRLKPEAAARRMGERMQDFVSEKIELGHLFKAGDLLLLEEMLMEAPDSAGRFARIKSFLLRNLRGCHAAPAPFMSELAELS